MSEKLLVDLHRGNSRQGPGSLEHTRLALALSGLEGAEQTLQIADLGCGTGASTLVLAEALNARITAVDLFPEFLEVLGANAEKAGLADKIQTLAGSMEALPFEAASLDAIWAEGSIYNLGFERGIATLKPFLKSL